jgi:hypothetical protein
VPGAPTPSSVLSVLAKARLVELGRDLAVALPASATKDQQIERLTRAAALDCPAPATSRWCAIASTSSRR